MQAPLNPKHEPGEAKNFPSLMFPYDILNIFSNVIDFDTMWRKPLYVTNMAKY
jgi:hypothetical protein